jgi:cytochrome b6-f complex iron-sulfur subunit
MTGLSTTRRALLGTGLLGGGLLGAGGFAVATRSLFRGTAEASRGAHDLGPVAEVAADLATRKHGIRVHQDLGLALVRYQPTKQQAINDGVAAGGVLALRPRCTHRGCSAPVCDSSGWFECPCHGSRFNRAGEYEYGPAPRGLDRYRLAVRRQVNGAPDRLVVDLDHVVTGPPRGVETIDSTPAGPHCTE